MPAGNAVTTVIAVFTAQLPGTGGCYVPLYIREIVSPYFD
jgi:hypothetical protein